MPADDGFDAGLLSAGFPHGRAPRTGFTAATMPEDFADRRILRRARRRWRLR